MNKEKNRESEAIKLQTEIVNATAKLDRLGFTISCTYIPGAGWASEIARVDKNTGEKHEIHELDEHSGPEIDEQDVMDAEQEKNQDYALDNMTIDISEEEQHMMDLENASIDQFNQERGKENE